MDCFSQRAKLHPVGDGEGQFADHFAGVAGNDRCAKNPSRTWFINYACNALLFTIEYCTIIIVEGGADRLEAQAGGDCR